MTAVGQWELAIPSCHMVALFSPSFRSPDSRQFSGGWQPHEFASFTTYCFPFEPSPASCDTM